tara:strand:- start:1112 stop:1834 length:723 start_codon:yes stop_codon:yes gene_type:complete
MAGIEDLKGKLISKNGMAMSNQYSVEMPSEVGNGLDGGVKTKLKGMSGTTANLLCKSVSMPGKQITTLDRQLGIFSEKIVNGFAVDDVTMTFYALNDYGAKKYFDTWRSAMLGEYAVPKEEPNEEEEGEPNPPKPTPLPKGTVGYKDDYVAPIKIHQLRKPIARVGFDIGPFSIDFDLLGASIYSVELIDAFPTTITSIELTNEADGLVEISVTFSYTNWRVIKDERGLGELKLSLGSIF